MNHFGLQLKKLRKAKGLNQDELAQILGVRKTTISNYETGYSHPSSTTLMQIADFFEVDFGVFMPPKNPINPEAPRMQEPNPFEETEIPVYASVTIETLANAQPLYSLKYPKHLLGEGNFFALQITGDRMARALLTDGSIAIVREQNLVDDGDIVAVSIDASPAMIGRFYRAGEYYVLAAESNNALHRPLLINQNEQRFIVLGKVVRVINPVV